MVVNTYNLMTPEAEAVGSHIQNQPVSNTHTCKCTRPKVTAPQKKKKNPKFTLSIHMLKRAKYQLYIQKG